MSVTRFPENLPFRQALAQGLFMNIAEYFKENDYRTVSFTLNSKI